MHTCVGPWHCVALMVALNGIIEQKRSDLLLDQWIRGLRDE